MDYILIMHPFWPFFTQSIFLTTTVILEITYLGPKIRHIIRSPLFLPCVLCTYLALDNVTVKVKFYDLQILQIVLRWIDQKNELQLWFGNLFISKTLGILYFKSRGAALHGSQILSLIPLVGFFTISG